MQRVGGEFRWEFLGGSLLGRKVFCNRPLPYPYAEIILRAERLLVPGGGLEPPRSCDLRILSPLRLPISPSGRCEFYRAGSTEEVIDLAGCCVSPQVDPSIITRGSMNRGSWFDSRPEVPASRF